MSIPIDRLRAHGPRWPMMVFLLLGAVLVALLGAPTPAFADSPFGDPAFRRPQGGSAGASPFVPAASAPAIPPGYAELPLPALQIPAPGSQRLPPFAQTPPLADPNNPLAWLALQFNPGKWLLDSVLGALAGLLTSIAAVAQTIATAMLETIVTTPRALTVDWPGDAQFGSPRAAANVVRLAAISIMTLILVYRLIRLLGAYQRQEAVDLIMAGFGGLIAIQSAWWFCGLLIDGANALARAILGAAFGDSLPLLPFTSPPGAQLSLVFAGVTLWYWLMLALLALAAIRRIVLVNVLLIVSPLIGLAILTGGAWRYARVWFFRFIELLVTPILWVATLAFARTLLNEFLIRAGERDDPAAALGQAILGAVLAGFAYLLVLQAPHAVGLAAREAVQSGVAQRAMTTVVAVVNRFA